MKKIDNYKQDLIPLIHQYYNSSNNKLLIDYLLENSNLPGKRGNIELGEALSEVILEEKNNFLDQLWELNLFLISFDIERAPTGTKEEFLGFCGTLGIATISSISNKYLDEGISLLKQLTQDKRWRVREAVAMGFQKLLIRDPQTLLGFFDQWLNENNNLLMRGIVVGLADPPLLTKHNLGKKALDIHKVILDKCEKMVDRKSEDFKTLRKSLGFTLGVIICQVPHEGFLYLEHLLSTDDKDIRWIVNENLKKNRLKKLDSAKVLFIKQLIKENS